SAAHRVRAGGVAAVSADLVHVAVPRLGADLHDRALRAAALRPSGRRSPALAQPDRDDLPRELPPARRRRGPRAPRAGAHRSSRRDPRLRRHAVDGQDPPPPRRRRPAEGPQHLAHPVAGGAELGAPRGGGLRRGDAPAPVRALAWLALHRRGDGARRRGLGDLRSVGARAPRSTRGRALGAVLPTRAPAQRDVELAAPRGGPPWWMNASSSSARCRRPTAASPGTSPPSPARSAPSASPPPSSTRARASGWSARSVAPAWPETLCIYTYRGTTRRATASSRPAWRPRRPGRRWSR